MNINQRVLFEHKTKLSAAIALGLIIACGFVLALKPVFEGNVLPPQSISIFFLNFKIYGIFLALSIIFAVVLAEKRAKLFKFNYEQANLAVVYVLVSGFLSARIYHILTEFGYYLNNFSEAIKFWHGGLSIIGAVIGGFTGLMIFLLKSRRGESKIQPFNFGIRIDFINHLNWLAPALALGQAIGRIGNFFNYEVYGGPTNLPWKMYIPEQFRISQLGNSEFVHPLFLYEFILCVFLAIALIKIKPDSKLFKHLFLIWALVYTFARVFFETLRVDSSLVFGWRINIAVILAIALVSIGVSFYEQILKFFKKTALDN